MSTGKFQSILANATIGEIEKPKPVPEGSYVALIKGVEYGETKSDKKTPYARVNLELVQALSDVNEASLSAFGPVTGKKMRLDFYLTEEALFRLQDFILDDIGLDMKGMTLDQALPQIINNQVGVKIRHKFDEKDATKVYTEVEKTFKP